MLSPPSDCPQPAPVDPSGPGPSHHISLSGLHSVQSGYLYRHKGNLLVFLIVSDCGAEVMFRCSFQMHYDGRLVFLIYIYKLKFTAKARLSIIIGFFFFFFRPGLSSHKAVPLGFELLCFCCLILVFCPESHCCDCLQ